jgi:hypothetical protein
MPAPLSASHASATNDNNVRSARDVDLRAICNRDITVPLLLAAALVTSKHFASEREPNQLFAETSLSSAVRAERHEGGSSARRCFVWICLLKVRIVSPLESEWPRICPVRVVQPGADYLRAGGSRSLGGKTDLYSLA